MRFNVPQEFFDKWLRVVTLVGSEPRIETVSDPITHIEGRGPTTLDAWEAYKERLDEYLMWLDACEYAKDKATYPLVSEFFDRQRAYIWHYLGWEKNYDS